MSNILAQVSDPNFVHGAAWIVGLCSVILTLGGAGLIVQKLVINGRILRREDVPQQVQVTNSAQKRDVSILPTLMTKEQCNARHESLADSNDTLIRLRALEAIQAYEAEAKKSRQALHTHIDASEERTRTETSKKFDVMDAKLDDMPEKLLSILEKSGALKR